MASKRASAIKQQMAQQEITDRMALIEVNQKLIMKALGIASDDAAQVEEADVSDKPTPKKRNSKK